MLTHSDLLNVPDCLLCGSAWVIRSVVDIITGWWTLLSYHYYYVCLTWCLRLQHDCCF